MNTYWTYDQDEDDNSPHIYEWTDGKVVARYCADDKGTGMRINRGADLDDYESTEKYTDKNKLFAMAVENFSSQDRGD